MNHRAYDISCPYCNADLDINHDDGCGYEEDKLHQQECSKCLKTFTYTTSIICLYSVGKSDCLNGGEHKYEPTKTFPVEATRLRCKDCGDEKPPEEAQG